MKNNISLLVGLKNNLDYTKHFYKTTRALYPKIEICFVSYASTDGTHEWLDSLNDAYLKYYYSKEYGTFSDTFNKAAEISTKEYVVYLHNDIVLAPNFIENLIKHISVNKVISYTTVEPPIFSDHERPGKIIRDFGIDLETFNLSSFYEFAKEAQKSYENKYEQGITFFMCLSRNLLLSIKGMDNLFNPMFCEDDDLIMRLKLLGLECITILDAICYHFVSKTSRFSEEYINTTKLIEVKSNRNYIRKWGNRSSTTKYNIAFVVSNCTLQALQILEPWCDRIYIDDTMQVITIAYIENEQSNTKFDLSKRVLLKGFNDPISENNIVIEFDANKLTNDSFRIIQQLADIIIESGDIGEFELDIFKITIKSLDTYEKNLIRLDDEYYTSKFIKI
jgi:GT2 family glycosyltransferase